MKKFTYLYRIIIIIIYICSSCNHPRSKIVSSKNDTTEVIRLLLDSTIYLPRLPNINLLYKNNPFGDSIIVETDSIIGKHLQKLGNFKLLTLHEIRYLAGRYSKDTLPFANFLKFYYYQKNDSIYGAGILNTRLLRTFPSMKLKIAELNKDDMQKTFRFLQEINSQIDMIFIKRKDTFSSKIENVFY